MTTRSIGLPISSARWFYVALCIVIASIVTVAFWPGYLGPLLGGTIGQKLPIVHVHAAIFFGFLLLFAAQAIFAATGRIELHRKLGTVGIGYGAAMVLVGVYTAFSAVASAVHAGKLEQAQAGLLTPLMDMFVFPIFFGAAIAYRRSPETHKRLMLVAITILLDSSASRIEVPYRQFIWLAPILLGMGYDFAARRSVHPAYLIGIITIYAMLQRRFIVGSDIWREISGWLIAIVFGPGAGS
jgi:hypothetical protein